MILMSSAGFELKFPYILHLQALSDFAPYCSEKSICAEFIHLTKPYFTNNFDSTVARFVRGYALIGLIQSADSFGLFDHAGRVVQ
jgi:hypothetical protein